MIRIGLNWIGLQSVGVFVGKRHHRTRIAILDIGEGCSRSFTLRKVANWQVVRTEIPIFYESPKVRPWMIGCCVIFLIDWLIRLLFVLLGTRIDTSYVLLFRNLFCWLLPSLFSLLCKKRIFNFSLFGGTRLPRNQKGVNQMPLTEAEEKESEPIRL